MRPMCALWVLTVVPGLVVAAVPGNGTKKAKNLIHGQVVAVQKGGDKTGSITVTVHHKKKNANSAAPVEKTVKISTGTTFEIVQGKKGAVQSRPADFGSVQKGQNILIFLNGGEATAVKIVKKGNGKKKNV
jgi:uncharacterized protein involved in tellurium resistance